MPVLTQANLVGLMNATVAALNGAPTGTFNLAFTAAPTFVPIIDVAAGDAVDLQVLVAPCLTAGPDGLAVGNGKRLSARRAVEYNLWIDVGVIQQVSGPDDALVPQLMLLSDLIYLYMLTMQLPSPLNAFSVSNATNEPPYDPTKLVSNAVFQSITTLRYFAGQTF